MVSAFRAKCSLSDGTSVSSYSLDCILCQLSSRQKYSAVPCSVGRSNSFSPFDMARQSSRASQDFPTFGEPARIYSPCPSKPSTENTVGLYSVVMISSQDFVISFFNLPSPFRFLYPHTVQFLCSLCVTNRSFLTWRAIPLQGIVAHFCSVGISPAAGFNFIRAKQKAPYIFSRTAKLTV